MNGRNRIVLSTLLVAAASTTIVSAAADDVVATVNGTPIHARELRSPHDVEPPPAEAQHALREQLIDAELLRQAAVAAGLDKGPDYQRLLAWANNPATLDRRRLELAAEVYREAAAATWTLMPVTDEEIAAYCADHQAQIGHLPPVQQQAIARQRLAADRQATCYEKWLCDQVVGTPVRIGGQQLDVSVLQAAAVYRHDRQPPADCPFLKAVRQLAAALPADTELASLPVEIGAGTHLWADLFAVDRAALQTTSARLFAAIEPLLIGNEARRTGALQAPELAQQLMAREAEDELLRNAAEIAGGSGMARQILANLYLRSRGLDDEAEIAITDAEVLAYVAANPEAYAATVARVRSDSSARAVVRQQLRPEKLQAAQAHLIEELRRQAEIIRNP